MPISISLSFSSRVLSYSFIWNMLLYHLILPNLPFLCLYIGRLISFPDLGKMVFCRKHSVHPATILLSGHQNYMLKGYPLGGLHGSFSYGGLTAVGSLVGMAGPLSNC